VLNGIPSSSSIPSGSGIPSSGNRLFLSLKLELRRRFVLFAKAIALFPGTAFFPLRPALGCLILLSLLLCILTLAQPQLLLHQIAAAGILRQLGLLTLAVSLLFGYPLSLHHGSQSASLFRKLLFYLR